MPDTTIDPIDPMMSPRRPASASEVDAYAGIAALYDLEHAGFRDDIELYRQFAHATGSPILELACGSGRILAPLAADGHRLTGIDRSAAMLERARSTVARSIPDAHVHLTRADMTAAADAPGGPFAFVIIGLNSLLHAESADEQRAILAAAHAASQPDALLVIDVLNPSPDALQALAGMALDGEWDDAAGGHVQKFSDRQIASATQTIRTSIWYDTIASDGGLRRTATAFAMRYVHHAELLLMLELAGWLPEQSYGSYELDPYVDDSDRLIVTARRG